MRNFRELTIWTKGMEIVNLTYDILEHLPDTEKFELRSQCGRAAVSIPSNIAEGCARKSQKHFVQFLETALGSTFELQTQVLIIRNRFDCPQTQIETLLSLLEEESKMLTSFINKVNS